MAVTAPVLTNVEVQGSTIDAVVATSTTVYQYSLVATNSSGLAVPASDADGLRFLGTAENTQSATGVAGNGGPLWVKPPHFLMDIAPSTTPSQSWVGFYVAAVDAATVNLATSTTYKVIIGKVWEVAADGSYVRVDLNDRFTIAVAS